MQTMTQLPSTNPDTFPQTGSIPWTVRAHFKKLDIATYFEDIFGAYCL